MRPLLRSTYLEGSQSVKSSRSTRFSQVLASSAAEVLLLLSRFFSTGQAASSPSSSSSPLASSASTSPSSSLELYSPHYVLVIMCAMYELHIIPSRSKL